jgi:hypothetical protein
VLPVDSLATWIFGIVAAAWLLVQFFLRREADPGAEIQLDVNFAGKQDGQWLIEVVVTLTNRGLVRHRYRNFRVVVRYLASGDPIRDGDKQPLEYQLFVPHSIDSRIDRNHRLFSNAEFIDPRLTFRHSYITFVPEHATFLLVQCSLDFPVPWKKKDKRKNTQKFVRVPLSEPASA